MTKKDFVKIAEAVRDARLASVYNLRSLVHVPREGAEIKPEERPFIQVDKQSAQIFDSMARTVADVCAAQNPKFDRKKFLTVCGVSS